MPTHSNKEPFGGAKGRWEGLVEVGWGCGGLGGWGGYYGVFGKERKIREEKKEKTLGHEL